jgi:Ca2+-binding EF-hand superfamily protein/biotin operon repressor
VRNPPGGKTTFSLGDPWSTTPPPMAVNPPTPPRANVATVTAVVAGVVPEEEQEVIPADDKTVVGVVVAGSFGVDSVIQSTLKALKAVGISIDNVKTFETSESISLPYYVKHACKTCDIIIAAAVVTGPDAASTAANLSSSLYNMGLNEEKKSIIPAILYRDSLLEVKVLASTLASSWASAAYSLIHLHGDKIEPTNRVIVEDKDSGNVSAISEPSISDLLDQFRKSLVAHGAVGIFSLGRKFRIMDDNSNGSLELTEFTKGITELKCNWSKEQIKTVFDYFDRDHSGNINYDEFLVGVRGKLNDRREQLVLSAFAILDKDHSGSVELNDIVGTYDASKHPDVIAGKKTSNEVLRGFLDTFDGVDKDGKVTPQEFCSYYENVSASIDNDDYFELMIRNAWHISGGEGWCANSSCRRVLVTHTDGRQTVEEIKNDLGISDSDIAAMTKNLNEQGISDIASIDVKGSAIKDSSATAAEGVEGKSNKKDTSTDHITHNSETVNVKHKNSRGYGGQSSIIFG